MRRRLRPSGGEAVRTPCHPPLTRCCRASRRHGPARRPLPPSLAYHTSIADTFFDWWCAMAAGRLPHCDDRSSPARAREKQRPSRPRCPILYTAERVRSLRPPCARACVRFSRGATTSSTTSLWAANADELPYARLDLPGFLVAATRVVLSDVAAGGCAGQSLSAPSSILYRAMAPVFSPCAMYVPPRAAHTGHLLVCDWALCSRSGHPPQRRDRAHRRPWPCSYGHNPLSFRASLPLPCARLPSRRPASIGHTRDL